MPQSGYIKNSDEILATCAGLGIGAELLSEKDSIQVIDLVLKKFNVRQPVGHLGIYHESVSVKIGDHEFTYSKNLSEEPVYLFFCQGSSLNKNEVIKIVNGKEIGRIMENSFGMEYFLTNTDFTFLLAINWYVIEGAGIALEWLKKLENS